MRPYVLNWENFIWNCNIIENGKYCVCYAVYYAVGQRLDKQINWEAQQIFEMNYAILTQHLSGLFLENFFLLLSLNGEKEENK